MPRRVDLPGADELFRPTVRPAPDAGAPAPAPGPAAAADLPETPVTAAGLPRVTGRVRHDEKITVYVSSEELLALEKLRLDLRGEHGLAVDRGRIVRAAIADALADLRANGGDARLIRRLLQS